MNSGLIDQIVQNVLAQLAPEKVAARPVSPLVPSLPKSPRLVTPPAGISVPPSPSTAVSPAVPAKWDVQGKLAIQEFADTVITADVLQAQVRPGIQKIAIGPKTIVTPSARDWLKGRKLAVIRGHDENRSQESPAGSWCLVLQAITPTVQTLKSWIVQQTPHWQTELVGTPLEAARFAKQQIVTASHPGVVVLTEVTEAVACAVNRHSSVRAVALSSRASWPSVKANVSPNLICLRPTDFSLMELRSLLQEIGKTSPAVPHNWLSEI